MCSVLDLEYGNTRRQSPFALIVACLHRDAVKATATCGTL